MRRVQVFGLVIAGGGFVVCCFLGFRVVFCWELSVESYVIRDNNLSQLVLFRRSLPLVRGVPVGRVVESSFWCFYLKVEFGSPHLGEVFGEGLLALERSIKSISCFGMVGVGSSLGRSFFWVTVSGKVYTVNNLRRKGMALENISDL